MKVGDFIKNLNSLQTINSAGLTEQSNLKENFLDFLYSLLSSLSNNGCKPILQTGTTTRKEYTEGSAIFISFKKESETDKDTNICYDALYNGIEALKMKYKTIGYQPFGNSVLVYLTQTGTEKSDNQSVTTSTTTQKGTDVSGLSFLDDTIGNITKPINVDQLTQSILGGVQKAIPTKEGVNNDNYKKLNEEIKRIIELLK